ncbi:BgTH12-05135 [Blumeria graminis f. sp. triticale]|uniref:BgtE-5559 n=3 Tax=Blumeria graminis TaxID=34373 RepID=A0A061HJM8_BLUGR|nr:putative secreted effector protein [Blumeria graminis f. sp. tritici 96224]CAD6502544.1 BgTH12-05135 [Blumeria graminis f. sp. triticale]VDB87938.1 BgtE-5559 [Blumeria graminis f. sp. tritici]
MHCQFLVISSLWIFGRGDTYQFDIIKPFEVGSINHYLRFEGSPKKSYQVPEGVTDEELRKTSKNHIIHKFCGKRKENLFFLEKHFVVNSRRKNDMEIDSADQDLFYKECHKKIDQYNIANTPIKISDINERKLSPCTVKILIQEISYRHAKAHGPYGKHSHQAYAKISLDWDRLIPFHELLDSKFPLMTMKRPGQLTHLVYIAGFLKLVVQKPAKEDYTITPALGNIPGNEIYEFLYNSSKHKKMSPHKVRVQGNQDYHRNRA